MSGQVVAYYRVSTRRQGESGLGLEAQREAVRRHLVETGSKLLAEYQDIETGKGSNALEKRPGLREAVALAKKRRATLVIAKLDRLARNVHFVTGLIETGVAFRCCDLPSDIDRTMLQVYAVMAEHEGRRISQRISEALQAKKQRGEPVGHAASLQPMNGIRAQEAAQFAAKLQPTIASFQAEGLSQRAIVERLNGIGVKTARGGEWSLVQLQRVLSRVSA